MNSKSPLNQRAHRPGLPALAFLFLLSVALLGCNSGRPNQLFSGSTMGTTWSVQISEAAQTEPQGNVQAEIEGILRNIDQQMSTYKADSLLNKLNSSAPGSEMPVSAELMEVLTLAKEIHTASGGAFDVSVAPLVSLWGFGPQEPTEQIPSADSIAQAMARVGLDAIELDSKQLLFSRQRDVSIDLSAIAKGYAVDRVARQLYKVGYRNFLVEVGGELRAAGTNQRNEYWTIGIETPVIQRGVPFYAASLNNKSIATSGDYRNFYERDGKRYSHTLDPRTGAPVEHLLASVTLIHDSAAAADGWATALNVLGPEEGLKLAEVLNLAAYFIVRTESGFVATESSAFAAYNESLNENTEEGRKR